METHLKGPEVDYVSDSDCSAVIDVQVFLLLNNMFILTLVIFVYQV